jgi:biotin carboxyl carrier protein
MLKIKVNQHLSFETDFKKDALSLNGNLVDFDIKPISSSRFHILKNQKSYLAELIEINEVEKTLKVKVNQGIYHLEITDQYDELLKSLGLDNINKAIINEIKAPMPGMVLKVLVKEGDLVKKGEGLLVLEAMKMENLIKAPADIKISKINVKSGHTVEKNQVLLVLN